MAKPAPRSSPAPADPDAPVRIAKRLARAGIASRRDAEKLIADGRVAVNGRLLDSPAVTVGPTDAITLDGRPIPEAEATRVWRYHKPDGLVTTAKDPQGRPTVFERLPEAMPRVMSVGRLDLTSEGLLLLTNDGALARYLELPDHAWPRRYRVRAFGKVDPDALARLGDGVTIDGVRYGPIEASLDRQQGGNAWLTMGLREGKNREIRRVLEHLGLKVGRLIRVSFGPFHLGSLPRGAVEEIKPKVLREQIPGYFGGQAGWAKRGADDRKGGGAKGGKAPGGGAGGGTPKPGGGKQGGPKGGRSKAGGTGGDADHRRSS
ncbi:MAG: pseudouridine synthase [Azospirillaceae bacterium]